MYEILRREEACRRQAYKQKETPKETKEFLRRKEACRRQADKQKETKEFLRREKARQQKRLKSF